MEELILLEQIDPNPYQLREREDPEHIERLADDIARNGLMQVPLGRRVGDRVQLTFGHSRLAAMRLLALQHGLEGQTRMPVKIQSLTDLEMFERGTSENLARKSLNPLEEAKGMVIYKDTFGKTSAEIGAYFGMSDSGVRNKMRLLKLPDEAQDWLRRGEISEGTARALIPMFEELTLAERQALENSDNLKPSDIIEMARSGVKAEQVASMVARLLNRTRADEAPPERQEPEPAPVYQPVAQPQQAQTKLPPAPAPAPIPAPARPAAQPVAVSAPAPVVEREEASEEDTEPATTSKEGEIEEIAEAQPAVEPQPAQTWESKTITISLVYLPGEDGSRMVMASGRADQGNLMMRALSEVDFPMSEALAGFWQELKGANA